jgi:hypothetical protein
MINHINDVFNFIKRGEEVATIVYNLPRIDRSALPGSTGDYLKSCWFQLPSHGEFLHLHEQIRPLFLEKSN